MTTKQIFVVVSAIVLVFILFFFADIVPPERRGGLQNPTKALAVSAGLDALVAEERSGAPDSIRLELARVDSLLQDVKDTARKQRILQDALAVTADEELVVNEARYQKAYAELVKTAEAWENSGDVYARLLFSAAGDTLLQKQIASVVIDSYEKALQLDENNSDLSVKLASAFMDGTNDVMKGVTLLLSVVDKEPGNIKANLILGRYGIMSGQYDKAIKRLETVVEQDSLNAEAYFYLAEAYNMQGDKAKAVELFEKTKSLVNDPDFSKEIDSYIQKIKNS